MRILYRTDNSAKQRSKRETHDRRDIRSGTYDIRLQGLRSGRDGKTGRDVHAVRSNRRNIRGRRVSKSYRL